MVGKSAWNGISLDIFIQIWDWNNVNNFCPCKYNGNAKATAQVDVE